MAGITFYSKREVAVTIVVTGILGVVVGAGIGANMASDGEGTVKDNEVVFYNALRSCAEDEVWVPADDAEAPIDASDLVCVHVDVLTTP
jgi:hypothetical protein